MLPMILDFETYYDDHYSLKKLTYDEYVRDPRFECILVSCYDAETQTECVFWGEQIQQGLNQLNLQQRTVVAHNASFDVFILEDVYGIHASAYGCTMLMSLIANNYRLRGSLAFLANHHGLKAKGTAVHDMKAKRAKDMTAQMRISYEQYCILDSHLCAQLYAIYRPSFRIQDLCVISETIRWGADCKYHLDLNILEPYLQQIKDEKQLRVQLLAEQLGEPITLHSLISRNTFARLLEQLGVVPPTKVGTNGKPTYAFAKDDIEFLALLDHPDHRVVTLCETKLGVQSSQAETRTQRFIDIARTGKGMPFPLTPFKAGTGRHGGTQRMNTQNLPKRGGDNTLRRAIVAPSGKVIITCDLSQIEVRVLATLAGEQSITDQFLAGIDVYSQYGTDFYGYPVSKHTKRERNCAKESILSLGYGAGAKTFRNRMETAYGIVLSDEEARDLVAFYRNRYSRVRAFWSDCQTAIEVMHHGGRFVFGADCKITAEKGKLILADGWVLHYDDLRIDSYDGYGRPIYSYYQPRDKKRKYIYGGLVANNITQATAGRIFQWHIMQLRMRGRIMSGAVHDELNSCIDIHELICYYCDMIDIMKTAPDWAKNIPIDCEFEVGFSYGTCTDIGLFIQQNEELLLQHYTAEELAPYKN